jgi:transcriptional regulator with XRE-family HTH domain
VRQTLERVLDDLGRKLAELRHEHGWTQQHAADKAGMLMRDYQAIENGKRPITLRTALTLAQTFSVPLRELFDPPGSEHARQPGRPRRVLASAEHAALQEPLPPAARRPRKRSS